MRGTSKLKFVALNGRRVACGFSRDVPVNDPCYSVNEGCFSDLLHTERRLRSGWAAFHQPFITQQTQRQRPANGKREKTKQKGAFLFSSSIRRLLKQIWQHCVIRARPAQVATQKIEWAYLMCGRDRGGVGAGSVALLWTIVPGSLWN